MDKQMKDWAKSQLNGYGVKAQEWREDTDYTEPRPVAVIGRYRVIDDEENVGLYAGDRGEVTAHIVGTSELGNRRISFSFCPDGNDEGNELPDLSFVEPV